MVNLGYPSEWQTFVPFYSKSQNFKQNQIEIPTTILCIGFSCDIMYWWLMTWIQQKIDVNLCSSDLHFGLIWNFVKYNCSDNHYIGLGQIWLFVWQFNRVASMTEFWSTAIVYCTEVSKINNCLLCRQLVSWALH